MSFANLQIRTGFADFFQPYSATILPTRTSIEQKSIQKFAGGYWILQSQYISEERIYGSNNDYAKSNWETRIIISVMYKVVNEDPF